MRPMRASVMWSGGWLIAVCAAVCVVAGASLGGGPAGADPVSNHPAPTKTVRYGRDIRPLLADRCFKCHGPDAGARRADLRLDQAESATAELALGTPIVPGKPDASEVMARISSTDPDTHMPPEGSGKRSLTAEEQALVRQWIADGAAYEPHWAFVPPKRPPVPEVKNAAWCKNTIDRFILSRLEADGIAPSPEANRSTLVRRVFLDLTGLPPTPEEVDAFVADASPDAYEKLVDRLLTEEPYRSRTAERLATPWLDAARYGDTCGLHTDNGRQIWPWRDWVLAAIRDNMPFDRFVTEQLAGDLIPNATTEQKVASGFNRNALTMDEGGAFADEYLVEYAVDRSATTATCFMALTMGCARCHDHKFDPISNEEFYKFYAYFNSIEEPGLYTQTPDANRAHEPFMEVPTPAQTARLAALAKEIEDLQAMQAQVTPEERSAYAEFLSGVASDVGVVWHATEVVGAKSAEGAKLTVQPDRSVLASGPNPNTDVHEITIRAPSGDGGGGAGPADVRLLLLEALGDPSLPEGRIGRALNGNAVLTGIDVEEVDRDAPEKSRVLKAQWLWADHSQGGGDYGFTNVLLGAKNTDRGWALDGHTTKPPHGRLLVVMLKDAISTDGKTDIRVRLRYESIYLQHVLGRVRLTLGSIRDTRKLPLEMSDWRLVGPFPSSGNGGENSPYREVIGPETATKFDFTQNFGAGNQFWHYDASLKDGVPVPLAVGQNVTFVAREIFSPRTGEISLPVSLGSDDGFVLYMNGKEVARREVDRGLAPDQDKATITLAPGMNLLVLKIVNTGGDSGYYFKPQMGEEAYPHDLVGGILPGATLTSRLGERVERAWRKSRSPIFRARQEQVDGLERESDRVRTGIAKTMVMKELETPRQTYVLTRGQYDQADKDRPVTRGVPAALGKMPEGAPANRLGLAAWMTAPDHPLTARVAMNRLWETVFGTGIVRTSEDFGQQGEWPSHPELLDWLAVEFREGGGAGGAGAMGWDQRRMLRMMVTSATYRQSSAVRSDLQEHDPDNRLLARYPRRRLAAEQVRDLALSVSGLLVEKLGGPSVKVYQPEGIWNEGALPASNTRVYERGKGEDLYRRSLYTYWKRAAPPPALQAFDAPSREFCVVHRAGTGTPLQALVLWNEPGFVEAARELAARTLKEDGDDGARLGRMYRRCTSRRAEGKDLDAMARALAEWRKRYREAPEDAAKLVMVGDAPVAEGTDKAELAAWTMVAGAMMSVYATTTQE